MKYRMVTFHQTGHIHISTMEYELVLSVIDIVKCSLTAPKVLPEEYLSCTSLTVENISPESWSIRTNIFKTLMYKLPLKYLLDLL